MSKSAALHPHHPASFPIKGGDHPRTKRERTLGVALSFRNAEFHGSHPQLGEKGLFDDQQRNHLPANARVVLDFITLAIQVSSRRSRVDVNKA